MRIAETPKSKKQKPTEENKKNPKKSTKKKQTPKKSTKKQLENVDQNLHELITNLKSLDKYTKFLDYEKLDKILLPPPKMPFPMIDILSFPSGANSFFALGLFHCDKIFFNSLQNLCENDLDLYSYWKLFTENQPFCYDQGKFLQLFGRKTMKYISLEMIYDKIRADLQPMQVPNNLDPKYNYVIFKAQHDSGPKQKSSDKLVESFEHITNCVRMLNVLETITKSASNEVIDKVCELKKVAEVCRMKYILKWAILQTSDLDNPIDGTPTNNNAVLLIRQDENRFYKFENGVLSPVFTSRDIPQPNYVLYACYESSRCYFDDL
ncbi:hypothetical protein TRFO_36206 [Tritrichomonas foetus]|uniref:Uncharacterized protein n=1 Tax=Tritrichomonas foetus TaxID=1144522 RepID=A0A1J4JJ19_9EUKA|nr:hypothetical protein TRFO_36206 [Tritrichomonas foetus]|eukprot:OHS97555.1 hypothetical protein TRFO_36206 [Tritrichomonas foetus]